MREKKKTKMNNLISFSSSLVLFFFFFFFFFLLTHSSLHGLYGSELWHWSRQAVLRVPVRNTNNEKK